MEKMSTFVQQIIQHKSEQERLKIFDIYITCQYKSFSRDRCIGFTIKGIFHRFKNKNLELFVKFRPEFEVKLSDNLGLVVEHIPFEI